MEIISAVLASDTGRWATIASLLLALVLIFTKDMIWSAIMSRRRIQKRHRMVRAAIEDVITRALEKEVTANRLTREQVDFHYGKLKRAGFKEVGIEPSFGRPWYYGPEIPPAVYALKSRIKARLPDWKMRKKEGDRKDIDDVLNKYK